jgi:hypothetical protein
MIDFIMSVKGMEAGVVSSSLIYNRVSMGACHPACGKRSGQQRGVPAGDSGRMLERRGMH